MRIAPNPSVRKFWEASQHAFPISCANDRMRVKAIRACLCCDLKHNFYFPVDMQTTRT